VCGKRNRDTHPGDYRQADLDSIRVASDPARVLRESVDARTGIVVSLLRCTMLYSTVQDCSDNDVDH
jgi:hypothetical protein